MIVAAEIREKKRRLKVETEAEEIEDVQDEKTLQRHTSVRQLRKEDR